jgi:hypothetical protein
VPTTSAVNSWVKLRDCFRNFIIRKHDNGANDEQ